VNRSLLRLILPALLVIGGAAWCVQSRRSPPSPIDAPPSPSTLASNSNSLFPQGIALLGGLKAGTTLDEWTVERIAITKSPKDQPQLALELARKGSGITVWIARKEAADNPPIATDRYGVSYGHPRPYGEPIPPGSVEAMGAKIANLIRANENTAPAPSGL